MIIPLETQDKPSTGYRLRRGTKLSDLPPQPPLDSIPQLSDINGAFQNAEYLALLVHHDPHDVEKLVQLPHSSESQGLGYTPTAQEWIYEHIRRIPIDLTPLITQLISVCNRQTCPEMKAQDWLYLCAAHGGSGVDDCCAIDYIFHMLDSTTALLNSSKHFPSRLQIPAASSSHFPSLLRRISRIFSHAYYHHREAFLLAESETSLYARFFKLCTRYKLVDSSLLFKPDFEPKEDVGRGIQGTVTGTQFMIAKEEEEEEEDGDEDLEIDSDEEEKARGREKNEAAAPARSHSLGRHPDPKTSLNFASPQSRKTAPSTAISSSHASETSNTESNANVLSGEGEGETKAMVGTAIKSGKATLSRGKGGRGKMLWTATDPIPESNKAKVASPVKTTSTVESGKISANSSSAVGMGDAEAGVEIPASVGMARSDSRDSISSAIHVEPFVETASTEDFEVPVQLNEDMKQIKSTTTTTSTTTDAAEADVSLAVRVGTNKEGEADVEGEKNEIPQNETGLVKEQGRLEVGSSSVVEGKDADGSKMEDARMEGVKMEEVEEKMTADKSIA